MNSEELERFFSKVNILGDNECWEWTASLTVGGYGHFWLRHRYQKSNRVSYEHFYGQIPNGLEVLHTCDNTLCVNPRHLFLGTQSNNMQDMVSKGRGGRQKLSMSDVSHIRNLISEGELSINEIAELYSVAQCTISNIKAGRRW